MSNNLNRKINTVHWPNMVGKTVARVHVGLYHIGIRFTDDTLWASEVSEGMLYHCFEQSVSLKEFIQNDHGIKAAIHVDLLSPEEERQILQALRQDAENSVEAQDRAKFLALKAKYGW